MLEKRRLHAYALIWEGFWAETRAMLAAQAMLPLFFTIALYNDTHGATALGNWVHASRRALTALRRDVGIVLRTVRVLMHENAY